MQNPLNEARRAEVTELAKAMLGTFTTQYALGYKNALVAKIIQDKQAGQPEEWLLPERPASTEPIRTGYLVKRGEIKKNWKKRWFVVRHDYIVEYYETEDKWKSGGKPKGRMMLSGFRVETDPNGFAKQDLEAVFKSLQIEEPVPDKTDFKPMTIELYHPSRRCWFIQCESEEEFSSWTETFKTVCWRAPGLANDDPVARHAFHHSIRETRWSLGRWGWWGYGGSEEDILSDMVTEHIGYAVLGGVWSTIDGAPRARRMARDSVMSAVASIVRGLVSPAYKAAAAAVVQIRPDLEKGIKTNIDPVIEAQDSMTEKIKDTSVGTINPAVAEHVTPHVGKLVDVLSPGLVKGHSKLIDTWEKRIDKYAEVAAASGTGDLEALGKELKHFAGSWWSIREAYNEVREIREPLTKLGPIMQSVSPWGIIWEIEGKMEKLMDNAMYYFESQLKEKTADGSAKNDGIAAKAVIDVVRADCLERFRRDAQRAVRNHINRVPMEILLPPLKQHVLQPCLALLAPLEAAIPEPVKDFISIARCFETLLVSLVENVVSTGTAPALDAITFQ